MSYLVRGLNEIAPELRVTVFRSRLREAGAMKHATVPLSLTAFAVGCASRSLRVVHINVAPRGSTWRKMLYAKTARALGCKILIHLHGSGYDEHFGSLSSRNKAFVRRFFGSADAVVALSEGWCSFLIEHVGVAPERAVVIPNGVPAATPEDRSARMGLPVIAFLGLVGARKGTDVLLHALAALAKEGVRYRVLIGGNGEVEAARSLAVELSIADRIEFLGWVDEGGMDAVHRAADIFVLPSRAENQPIAILEAMARSTPVISTRVGAIPFQVIEGETGLLIEPGDVTALTRAIVTLIEDPERRRAMGAAGRRRFESHFSVTSCAARFADLYKSLAARD
jgi:glycosyltransferase involved in cell wall biosynthesis